MKRKQFGIIQIILVELLKCVWLEAANVIACIRHLATGLGLSFFFLGVFSYGICLLLPLSDLKMAP